MRANSTTHLNERVQDSVGDQVDRNNLRKAALQLVRRAPEGVVHYSGGDGSEVAKLMLVPLPVKASPF